MDGVRWSTTRAQESFSRSRTPAETLSKLASFIARAETKQTQNQRTQPSHLPMYVCQECGKGFPFATDLLHHQDHKHTLPKPHRCPSCGQEFSLKSSLHLHQCDRDSSPCEICNGEPRLSSPCPACTTRTSDQSKPVEKSPHCQPHVVDGSPYACAPCGRGFNQKQALLHHQQAGCGEPDVADARGLPDDSPPVSEGDSSDTPGSSGRTVGTYQFCPKTFCSEVVLHRHTEESDAKRESTDEGADEGLNGDPVKRTKSKKKLLNCRSCDMVFRSTSELYLHRKEKHTREKMVSREPRPIMKKRRKVGAYPCQVCGKVFLHHLSLRAHYRQHPASSFTTAGSGNQSVGCSTKDPPVDSPNTVKRSLAENKTKRPGPGRPRKIPRKKKQEAALESFREVPEIEEAEEVVMEEEEEEEEEEEREFPCPSCAEVFSQQSQLREHMELHQSSVKRRQCSVCTSEMDTCKWPGSKRQRLYHCVPCQQGFSLLESFLEHCQDHLRVRVEEDSISEGQQASKA